MNRQKNRTPQNETEVLEVWINGFRRPVIGTLVNLIIEEGEITDKLLLVVFDGSTERIIDADDISSYGENNFMEAA